MVDMTKATCFKSIKSRNLMRYFGIVVIISLSLLLIKGFTYAVPVYLPKGSNTQRSVENRTLTCADQSSGGYIVNVKCRPCTKHEMKFKDVCLLTGNIEEIGCKKTKKQYTLSCPFAIAAEAKKFWVFQSCVVGMALLSNGVVWWRRHSLNSLLYQRLKRQISDAGV